MMIGEAPTSRNPTIQVPKWDPYDDPMDMLSSSFPDLSPHVDINGNANSIDSFMALHRFLPSKEFISAKDSDSLSDSDLPVDAVSCDYFRMYEFKVRRCARGRSHDWTECPYVHPGEKARRRDPRKYHYSGTACPDYRKSGCSKGDLCDFAHGVFESWLHPARYRTQPCKDGPDCCRRVCFFAHTPEELRVLPQQSPRRKESGTADSPIRRRFDLDSYVGDSFVSSPTSILTSPPAVSPSDSPSTSPSCEGSFNSVDDLVSSMRGLYIGKVKMGGGGSSTRVLQMGSGFGSPRCSILKPGFSSLPSTPTRTSHGRFGLGRLDTGESSCKEEPTMERVESGRALRGKMYAKLSKENPLNRVNSATSATDIGWVYELVN